MFLQEIKAQFWSILNSSDIFCTVAKISHVRLMNEFIVFTLDFDSPHDLSNNSAVILTLESIDSILSLKAFCIICIVDKCDGNKVDFKTNKSHIVKNEFQIRKPKFEIGVSWNVVSLTNLST